MSQPNQKPDLDESINVTESHARLVREAAACARENRIQSSASGNFSTRALAIGAGLLLSVGAVGGSILNNAGSLFSYNATFREGYLRKPAPGGEATGPVPKEALAAYMAKGAKIYSAKCNGCHGSDAKGNGSSYPALAGSAWVNGETQRFAMIVLNGLQGPVSNGTNYGVMPAQGVGMTPEDLAGILTYVRNNFGNSKGDVVTTEMAKAAIDASAARKKAGSSVTGEELAADHAKNLAGDVLDPKMLLDPISLAPAKTK